MLGIDIASELKRRGYTQKLIARAVGCSRQTVNNTIYDRYTNLGGNNPKCRYRKKYEVVEYIAGIFNLKPKQVKDWYTGCP